jgi:peptidyl-prolyl cis-trans isomerase B (cyclophilin B)
MMRFTVVGILSFTLFMTLSLPLYGDEAKKERKTYPEPPKMKIDVNKTYTATIDTSKGKIVVELFPKEAPITVNSFVFLAKEGFYDGLTFHRVEDWVIQGGDPDGTGSGGPGYQIKNEAQNNTHKHHPGTLAMARTSDPDSAGSQFYFTKKDAAYLDGSYTIFGQATEGLDVINKIEIGDAIKSIKIEEK